jgi:catechol 2,3-dioxygenase-like lactoylglutathione lyase family enzyme
MHVEALDHIHIYSVDPDASSDFYQRHFEGTVVQRHDDGPSVLLALGGKILIFGPVPAGVTPAEPTAFTDGTRTPGVGVGHFGLRVADVKAAVEELAGAGVEILAQPVATPDITFAYIGAPDGVVVELTQYEIPG